MDDTSTTDPNNLLSQLQSLLAGNNNDGSGLMQLQQMFAPTAADKHAALTQSLLQFGANTLAAKGVNPWQAIGQGAVAGVGSYNNDIRNAQAQRAQNLGMTMQMQQMLRSLNAQSALAGILNDPGNGSSPQPTATPGISPKTAAQFGPASSADNSGMDASLPPTPLVATPGAPPMTSTSSNWQQQMPDAIKRLLPAMGDPKAVIDAISKYSDTKVGPDGTVTSYNGTPIYKMTDAGVQYFNHDGSPGAFAAFGDGNTKAAAAKAGAVSQATAAGSAQGGAPYELTTLNNDDGTTSQMPKSQALWLTGGGAPPSGGNPTQSVGGVPVGGPAPGLAPTVGGVQLGRSQSPAAAAAATDIAKTQAANYTSLQAAAQLAPNNIAKLNQLQSLLSNVATGKGAASMDAIKSYAQYLAPGVIKSWGPDVTASQAAQSLLAQMTLDMRDNSGGRMTPEVFQTMQNALPNISTDPGAIKVIIDNAIAQQQHAMGVAGAAAKYRQANRGDVGDGLTQAIQAYQTANPLFGAAADKPSQSGAQSFGGFKPPPIGTIGTFGGKQYRYTAKGPVLVSTMTASQ